jgi:hypothetical protein
MRAARLTSNKPTSCWDLSLTADAGAWRLAVRVFSGDTEVAHARAAPAFGPRRQLRPVDALQRKGADMIACQHASARLLWRFSAIPFLVRIVLIEHR